ncbi:pseudaminic acid synthase [Maricaulis sp.]|uniref:pseudaminic acid synthase n=1 Tax=Maricaulis sp. TaxID=1486257 RepID=UPI000C39CA36|nr:pseudaminic acid synthase [Maricaulis sp.]MAC87734.1 pseudaminic acid synthase [Maricaulis sp.]
MTQDKTGFEIAGRPIGPDHPPLVIAEVSANHLGRIDRALETIEAAAACGADAIKIQTYTADTITMDHDGPGFVLESGPWAGRTLYDLYKEAGTPFEWHGALFAKARACGVPIFSTPFDFTAVDLLEDLEAPAYKIASFEAVDLPLIARVAQTGKPMIISTGMANLGEIDAAVRTARENGATGLALLHCLSAYPAPIDQADLRTIPHLGAAFDVIPGLSDHTPGTACAVAAVALGARVIEKHFTLSRADGGPDSEFSLEPDEMRRLVQDCHAAFHALGSVRYGTAQSEAGSVTYRRSLYAVADIAAGQCLTADNVRSIRPGHGLAPSWYEKIIGRPASRDIKRGEPLQLDLIDWAGTDPAAGQEP